MLLIFQHPIINTDFRILYKLAAESGFEPEQNESESFVLPLHNQAISMVRAVGLEPTRHKHTPLKRACLPVPACSHLYINSIRANSLIILRFCLFVNTFFKKFLKFSAVNNIYRGKRCRLSLYSVLLCDMPDYYFNSSSHKEDCNPRRRYRNNTYYDKQNRCLCRRI